MKYAKRLELLGTETAFSVSLDASNYALKGNTIYPFHLGDINICTPKNIIEPTLKAMQDGKTGYNPSSGLPELRSILAEIIGKERKLTYNLDNVIIQPGGKPVISKFIQALMDPGDGVLYPNPGYPIYESQIEFHGGIAIPYRYVSSKKGFKIDRDYMEDRINKNTRLLIYNNYQNPMGSESKQDEMEWIAELVQKHDLFILSDEAYFNIRYSGISNSISSLPGMQERTVILYTFSKTFAMTGWRLGAAIAPKNLINIFSKLAVNDESCTNHFIQYGGIEALTGKQNEVENILIRLKKRRDTLANHLLSISGIKLFIPESTFYLYPDVTNIYNNLNCTSYEEFRKIILKETGVSFCTREHFGTPLKEESRKYIRFAYSGINVNNINDGMNKLKEYLLHTNMLEKV